MKIKSINNPLIFVTWDLRSSKYPIKDKDICRSKLQFTVGQVLKEKYPFDSILEDVVIPETRLSLDFLLPQRKLAIEAQGQQHFERSNFFHKKNIDFLQQQERDNKKKYFCKLNNILLITVTSAKELSELL